MGFLFSDGADAYGDSTDLIKKYGYVDASINWNATGGKWGGGGIEIPASTDALQLSDFATRYYPRGGPHVFSSETVGPIHMSFWMKTDSDVVTGSKLIEFICAADGTDQASIYLEDGKLHGCSLDATTSTTQFGLATANVVDDTGWHHVEIAASYDSTDGFLKIWIDGNIEINFSGDNVSDGSLGSYGITRIILYGGVGSSGIWYDDILVWDEWQGSHGGELAASYVGPIRIETCYPNANGTLNEFTPGGSGSANYDRVDEVDADEDTTYVEASVENKIDMYGFTDPTLTAAYFLCCVVNARAKNPDIGDASMRLRMGTPTVQSESVDKPITTAYAHYQHAFMRHPATGAVFTLPWDSTLEIGVKNVAV